MAHLTPGIRKNVLQEIWETEVTYIDALDIIEEAYAKPLKDYKLIEQKDYDVIFKELNSIRLVNKTFLGHIEKRMAEDKDNKKPTLTVGEIFFKFAPIFKSYSAFCNNYDNVSKKIVDISSKNKGFAEFLKTTRQSKISKGYDLLSLLIMPIQRIPRYNLLLKELTQNTSKHHRDYEYLAKGLEAIKSTADYVNQKMKDFENQVKVQEVSNLLGVNLIKTSRAYRGEGTMKVLINPLWEERLVILMNDSIYFCNQSKKDVDLVHSLELDCLPFSWMLDIKDQGDIVNAIHLVHRDETIIIMLDSAESKKKWVGLFETVFDDLLKRPNIDGKNNRANLSPQKLLIKRRSSSSVLNLFGKGDDKTIYPLQRKEIVALDTIAKMKPCGYARTNMSHGIKILDDELICNDGDIIQVFEKVKNSNTDWYVAKKLGCCSSAMIGLVTYKEYFDLYVTEKKKKITIAVNVISLQEPPRLLIQRKIDQFDSVFFEELHNLYAERDQIGIIPVKATIMIPENVYPKLLDWKAKRDEKEELKVISVRNFKIIKK